MGQVPALETPPSPPPGRRRAAALRRTLPDASRFALVAAGTLAGALADVTWIRAAGFLVVLLLVYASGYADGRRDLASGLLRETRLPQKPTPAPPPDEG